MDEQAFKDRGFGQTIGFGRHSALVVIDVIKGFTNRYNCELLVWLEVHETRKSAFDRERRLKKWERAWKIRLIEEMNPPGAI